MNSRPLWSILLIALFLLLAAGCDSTSSRTVSLTVTADPPRLGMLEYSEILAQAQPNTRDEGVNIYYRIEFSFSRNESGATLVSAGNTTDGKGEARARYRAGARPGIDIVQVRLDDDVTASVTIIVEEKGAVKAILGATPERVDILGYSNLTAEFTQDDEPLGDYLLDFVISQNQSGATLNAVTPATDVNGRAMAIYQAGRSTGVDMVQIIGQGGETASQIIVVGPEGPVRFAISASPEALTPYAFSDIVLTVTQGNSPLVGYRANFTFSQNQSGATLLPVNPYSDSQGRIRVLYQAGNAAGIDIIQAQGDQGEIAAVGVIVSAGEAISLALSASPATLSVSTYSDIQAQVRRGTQPLANYRVTFSITQNASGATLTIVDTVTNSQGNARAIYRAGVSPGIDVVRATGEGGQVASVGLTVNE